jgi:hypothetical protein
MRLSSPLCLPADNKVLAILLILFLRIKFHPSFLVYRYRGRWALLTRGRRGSNHHSGLGADPPPPLPLSVAKDTRKLPPSSPLGKESDTAKPNQIEDMQRSFSPYKRKCWTNSGDPLVNSLLWDTDPPVVTSSKTQFPWSCSHKGISLQNSG